VYIRALPVEEMSGVLEIGAKSAAALFGTHVSRFFSVAIALGLLSVLSAMIMTGPRIYYAMAKDGVFFKGLGRVNADYGSPGRAIFLQAMIAGFMVVTASFDQLLLYVGFTLSLFSMLTVMGLIRLRCRGDAPLVRYRTIGYPLTPLLFVLGSLWIIFFSIKNRPLTCVYGFGTVVLGVLLYFMFRRKSQ
jgi:APA family basic amino acid/polyamine antiporter